MAPPAMRKWRRALSSERTVTGAPSAASGGSIMPSFNIRCG